MTIKIYNISFYDKVTDNKIDQLKECDLFSHRYLATSDGAGAFGESIAL